MTTAEIEAKFAKQTREINALKSYNTKLSKSLIDNKIEVPVPNWKELKKDLGEGGDATSDNANEE
jgi:hypothetical protein